MIKPNHSDDLGPLFAAAPSRAPVVPRSARVSGVRNPRPRRAGYTEAAPAVASAPSRRAAERIEPKRVTKAEAVYRWVLARGAYDPDSRTGGATRPEIAIGTGFSENTVRPRVCELLEQQRLYEVKQDGQLVTRDERSILVADAYAAREDLERPNDHDVEVSDQRPIAEDYPPGVTLDDTRVPGYDHVPACAYGCGVTVECEGDVCGECVGMFEGGR